MDHVSDWKEAITIASQPLINEAVFDQGYIDAMIQAVETYGPYIVLADEFALPHASNQGNVNAVAISLLVTKEAVDMKGKPVKIFMVLATVDSSSHLEVLAALTDIISVDANLDLIKKGDADAIYRLFNEGENI